GAGGGGGGVGGGGGGGGGVVLGGGGGAWDLSGQLTAVATARLRRAGARVTTGRAGTRVDWPGSTLRDFMLFDGLMHEIGHHTIQHAARKQRTRAMRTADHEHRADASAMRARQAWAAQS